MTEKRFRSAITGEWVTEAEAEANPDTTVAVTVSETPRLDAAIHRAEQFHGTTATDSNDEAPTSAVTLANISPVLRPARVI